MLIYFLSFYYLWALLASPDRGTFNYWFEIFLVMIFSFIFHRKGLITAFTFGPLVAVADNLFIKIFGLSYLPADYLPPMWLVLMWIIFTGFLLNSNFWPRLRPVTLIFLFAFGGYFAGKTLNLLGGLVGENLAALFVVWGLYGVLASVLRKLFHG
ncbi:MAG: DUF2878 family protein [Deltaproteobacteria bacterium]|nr:DUF2878 family protein [Deltaproteobacteria bacterium]